LNRSEALIAFVFDPEITPPLANEVIYYELKLKAVVGALN
jgi:hypothetical protein